MCITKGGVIFSFVSKSTQLVDTLFSCYSRSIQLQNKLSRIVLTNLWGDAEGGDKCLHCQYRVCPPCACTQA